VLSDKELLAPAPDWLVIAHVRIAGRPGISKTIEFRARLESPMPQDELIALEEQGWNALSSDGAAARAFYERTLDRAVVMLLPGGLVLDDRDAIVDSMSGQPWSSFELEDVRVFQPTDDTGMVTYGVLARRDGQEYSALLSSLYARRESGWKLTFHQQTPR
jgi:Domain of unknown function (DUF4440)